MRCKCAAFGAQQPRESMLSVSISEYSWQFVSQDLFQFNAIRYLVTVNHYSDYIEIDDLENNLSATVISKSKAIFSRHGILEIDLTDNCPSLCAQNLPRFVRIMVSTTSLHHHTGRKAMGRRK